MNCVRNEQAVDKASALDRALEPGTPIESEPDASRTVDEFLALFESVPVVNLHELAQAGSSIAANAPNADSCRTAADLAGQIERYICACTAEPLQTLLREVFVDPELHDAFLTRPASRAHHHAWPGGLAEHSLEVAAIIDSILVHESTPVRALASAAGLLHDLGKLRTIDRDGTKTGLGWVVHHDALTLELLSPSLAHLDVLWPDGAAALRYLLTWNRDRNACRPLLPAALALEFADRYSSAVSAEYQAFQGAPPWQRFAVLAALGPRNRFWRPRAYQRMLPPGSLEQDPREASGATSILHLRGSRP